MNGLFPYPLLTTILVAIWVMLNSFSLGQLILGTAIAVAAARVTVFLQPPKSRVKSWRAVFKLTAFVTIDILRSNVAVAKIALFDRDDERRPGFVTIPLELSDRTGLAVLACIITSTPGTAWIEYAPNTRLLFIHVLDLVDEREWVHLIKTHYESLLVEIFE